MVVYWDGLGYFYGIIIFIGMSKRYKKRMLTNIPSYIFLNDVFTQAGRGLKKVSYEIINEKDGFTAKLSFTDSCEVNNIGVAFDIQEAEIVFMPRLQRGKKGLVCNNSNTQIILLRTKDSYFLLKVCGILQLDETYLRFATKIKENLLCIGFFHSFWIDEKQNSFCFQNLLPTSRIKKGSNIKIEVKVQKGSSIYDCVENFNPRLKSFEAGLNLELANNPKYVGIVDIMKYSKIDIARKYRLSLGIPAKMLKIYFLYLPRKLMNFELSYTSSLQFSCFYYIKILSELSKSEILSLQENIELLSTKENIYFNFYNKNLMLTSIKTYYHLPYFLLLYTKLCSLTGKEIKTSIERLIGEIEWHVIRNYKFFTDETLMNIEEFDRKFENGMYPNEALTIYICYELYRFLFNYYEDLSYYKTSNDLKALLFLYYDFKYEHFYKNNYSFKKEELLRINEREDRR
ncbi:hypothetical protein [Caldicellulosiruptor acetigenus]|uniref:Uncharacterized protein n=1 Tax=Caldicellulosiruptor acetigenus 6A TaxID=632516 RepID=G2PU72_9FIRM|nr:hypothetical protein [Caldicellulosiruptor acetigenus]AEM73464.1 hypothetical protein Calla_0812 [Caldicellulosiruptor acetigenus 6A]